MASHDRFRSLRVSRGVHIDSLDMDADDWELFGASKYVAPALNTTLMSAVNSGKTRRDVEEIMRAVMDSFEDFGASDSEPRHHLAVLLDKIYGEDSQEPLDRQ